MNRLPTLTAVVLAFASGILVFGNYFWNSPLLGSTSQFLLKIVVLVSGVALLMAALNLAIRHVRRFRERDVGSMLLVGGFVVAFLVGVAPGGFQTGVGRWMYHWLLAPGMAAVFALVPIFLAYALYRHLDLHDVGGFLFFVGMVVGILGQMPALAAQFPILTNFRQFFLNAPGAAAFRGIVLGLAVGVVLALLLKVFSIFTGRRSQTQVRETD